MALLSLVTKLGFCLDENKIFYTESNVTDNISVLFVLKHTKKRARKGPKICSKLEYYN